MIVHPMVALGASLREKPVSAVRPARPARAPAAIVVARRSSGRIHIAAAASATAIAVPAAHGQNEGRATRTKEPLIETPTTVHDERHAPARDTAVRPSFERRRYQAALVPRKRPTSRNPLPAPLRVPDEPIRLCRWRALVDPDAIVQTEHRLAEITENDDTRGADHGQVERAVTVENADPELVHPRDRRVELQPVVERDGHRAPVSRRDAGEREHGRAEHEGARKGSVYRTYRHGFAPCATEEAPGSLDSRDTSR